MEKTFDIRFVTRSHLGRVRRNNEDFLKTDLNLKLAAIADGMGGQAYGEVASQLAVDACIEYLSEIGGQSISQNPEKELSNAVAYANEAIITIQRNQEKYRHMGTTLSCFVYRHPKLYFSWIGDSRIYLISPEKETIRMLTTDHTLDRSKVDAKLAPALYKRASSILTQKIGSILMLKPDHGSVAAQPGDIVLACTDGLTDKISDDLVLQYILESEKNLDHCADRLIDRALDCGGQDNISLVLADLNHP
jgi:protein phosphatase